MKLYATRSFHRTQLLDVEKQKCWQAIDDFRQDPWRPSLKYEPLAKRRGHNHCSIRASLELRVILAVEPDFANPAKVILVRMDHHDPAYRWAERQGFQTDPNDGRNLDGDSHQTSIAAQLAELDRLEEWMLFLHPAQQSLVERQYAAEARIRGGAGTGKTVVALHRAAELGRRYDHDKVLFTTFSRSLTDHLERLFRDLPEAPRNVEFLNIDRIAAQLAPATPDVDPPKARTAFDDAYEQVIVGTSMESIGPEYLRAEIERVIKGRGASGDEYLDTSRFERLGRKRSFNRVERELCWRLREAWDRKMQQAECVDFPDRLVMARDVAREQNNPPYRAAIIDEAQDLTTVAVQLVRALVAGAPANRVPPDGLLLLDDAAQRIYRGGSRPAWAGLDVKGRSEILKTNYRNTRQVVEAAAAVRGPKMPVKEDDDDGAAWPSAYELPDGPIPVFKRVGTKGEVPALIDEIERLHKDEGIDHAHMAVLTVYNEDAQQIANALRGRSEPIPCVLLRDLSSKGNAEGVRVGTFDRGKGLEFEAVLIPRLGQSVFPRMPDGADPQTTLDLGPEAPSPTDEGQEEARQFELDRLYVGMTRARRWLFLVADEAPCPEIERAWECFDWRKG